MHNKNQKNNHEQVTHHISSWLGMNNQGYREYLNTIVGAGQQDSLNIDHLKKHSNGIREAVAIYYRKLKVGLLTELAGWQKKTDRISKKLTDLRSEIKETKDVNSSLKSIRFFRGFLYTVMGLIFFLGEVEFSKQTIIVAMQMGNIPIWWQAALVLALASTTGLFKLVYERFIEPYYDEREVNSHKRKIRIFYFSLSAIVLVLFMVIAFYRAIIAELILRAIDNPYEILSIEHGFVMASVYVVIAVLFLLGSAILLPVGLKELSSWYKAKTNNRLLKKLMSKEKLMEKDMDDAWKNLNEHKNTLEFMDNKEDFNNYQENEIQFFNTQYQRGIVKGVIEIENDDILGELESNTNQQQKGLHIDKDLHEEVKAIDDFHLHVRNKLDKTAQLN